MASNVELVARVARRLADSQEQFVSVGGAVVGLLITDRAADTPRPTDDVDVIVEVAGYADYVQRLEPELKRLGFKENIDAKTTCSWLVDGVKVDVMPTDEKVLGFTNRWYLPAIENAGRAVVEGIEISVIAPPYFLATKFDAFHHLNRKGHDDHGGVVTISRTSSE